MIAINPSPSEVRREGVVSGLYREPVISSGLYREPVVSSGLYREPVVSSGLYREPAVSSGLYREPVVSSGLYREPVVSSGLYREPIVNTLPTVRNEIIYKIFYFDVTFSFSFITGTLYTVWYRYRTYFPTYCGKVQLITVVNYRNTSIRVTSSVYKH
jgi:hypothetical protein